jgi:carbonic anhydrase
VADPCRPASANIGNCPQCTVFQSPLALSSSQKPSASIIHSRCCASLRFSTDKIAEYEYQAADKHWRVSTSVTTTANELGYKLVEFHFHQPGEHTLNRDHYPIEAHFVFESASGQVLVFGWVAALAASSGKKTKRTALFHNVLNNRPFTLPRLGTHWSYSGSLTTPPFTKSINWVLSSNVLQITAEQLAALKAKSKPQRPLQQREGRDIAFTEKK